MANENPDVADQPRQPAGQSDGGQWTTGGAGGAQMAPSRPVLTGGNNWTPPVERQPDSKTGLTDAQRHLLQRKNSQAVGIIAQFGDKGETPDTAESILNGPLKSGWESNPAWLPGTPKWDLRHQYKGLSDGDIALMESTRRNVARALALLAEAGKLSKSEVTALQLRGLGVLADATLKLALALAPYDSVASLVTRSLLGAPAAVIDTGVTKAVGSAAGEAAKPNVAAEEDVNPATEISEPERTHQWTNPITAKPGQMQTIDPASVKAGQQTALEESRIAIQKNLIETGTPRTKGPPRVTEQGIVYDGHHHLRASAEMGQSVKVQVIHDPDFPSATDKPVTKLPIYQQ